MAQRYGRRQKRAARAAIEAAEQRLNLMATRVRNAERAVATAKVDGANELLRVKYLPAAIDRVAVALGRAIEPELRDIAIKLLTEQSRHRPMSLTAYADPMELTVTSLEIRMPEFRCRTALWP